MIFLSSIVKPSKDVLKAMQAAVVSDKPIEKDTLKGWIAKAEEVDEAINTRTFIVMTAQTKGWGFAKEVDFFKSGICSLLLNLPQLNK